MSDLLGNVKKLGFGLMRLPMKGDEVDMEQTKQMVDLFLEKGFTYFDTAYGYLDGKSEEAAKEALVDRYPRERFQLATKLPAWAGPSTAREAREMFWTSLKRTGVEYFDCYLLHNLGGMRSEAFDRFGIWDFLEEQKKEGRIRHLGFSFHDKAEVLDQILTTHPEMEFVQLQINYADWDSEVIQSGKCYEVAGKYGKPIIIMEPVKGGVLANPPQTVSQILLDANSNASPASWAIRFAASLEGIVTVLSGMSTLEQMKDNLSFMENYQPPGGEELSVLRAAQKALEELPQIPCTDCQYCVKGCPENIAIPGILGAMNIYSIYNDLKQAKGKHFWATLEAGKGSACTGCGQCEATCPQSIPIIKELARAASLLEG